MNSRNILIISVVAFAVILVLPDLGFAADSTDSKDLLKKSLDDDILKLKDTIFGTPMKIAGIMGGGYGILQSILTSSPRPFMMWGAIGLVAMFMNKVVSAIFGV